MFNRAQVFLFSSLVVVAGLSCFILEKAIAPTPLERGGGQWIELELRAPAIRRERFKDEEGGECVCEVPSGGCARQQCRRVGGEVAMSSSAGLEEQGAGSRGAGALACG